MPQFSVSENFSLMIQLQPKGVIAHDAKWHLAEHRFYDLSSPGVREKQGYYLNERVPILALGTQYN